MMTHSTNQRHHDQKTVLSLTHQMDLGGEG